MSNNSVSRFWGVVAVLGLTMPALLFLAYTMDEAGRQNPPIVPVFGLVAVAGMYVAVVRGPIGRGIGRMLEGHPGVDDQLAGRVNQLEAAERRSRHGAATPDGGRGTARFCGAAAGATRRADHAPASGGELMARDRSNEWIGSMFVGLGMGAVGVAGALAWVTSAIGPASIPIWAIAAWGGMMIFRGPFGKALATRVGGHAVDGPVELPPELYGELDELRARLGELEERVDFSERLLTRDKSVEGLPAPGA